MLELNKVMIVGRLGRDPELRFTPSGTAVTTLNVAASRTYKVQNEKRDETCWINVIVWGAQAENCSKYLIKGQGVYVEGRLQSRNYETKDGQKRSVIEINANRVQFLDKPKGALAGDAAPHHPEEVSDETHDAAADTPPDTVPDEDIPF